MFQLFKRKASEFFSNQDKEKIVDSIKKAELETSGEVRVYIESNCSDAIALDRAVALFHQLEMNKTSERNGVLVYIALKDRKLAVYADEGIYQKVGKEFWEQQIANMIQHFNKKNYADGIAAIVTEIGNVLQHHFPYNKQTDINELPDDIVFGK